MIMSFSYHDLHQISLHRELNNAIIKGKLDNAVAFIKQIEKLDLPNYEGATHLMQAFCTNVMRFVKNYFTREHLYLPSIPTMILCCIFRLLKEALT